MPHGRERGAAYLWGMETRVLYNDECPVCSFEIGHYRDYAERSGLPLRFDDLNRTDMADYGITEDMAARRLHVLKEGEVLSGMPAFRLLWAEMPRYRWLARAAGWPVVRPVSEFAYDRVLAPLIYRWHLARLRKAGRPMPRRELSA